MKKQFYLVGMFACLFFVLPGSTQGLLDPKTQPQFVNPLPIPPTLNLQGGGAYTIAITQFDQNLGVIDPLTKQPVLTRVWGYQGNYPGPTILARKDQPLTITWQNQLTGSNGVLPHLLPVDPSVHWALSGRQDYKTAGVPLVTHLHGGHTESASDGLPEAWFTPNFALKGKDFVKAAYYYKNDQEAATMWYHDHALGITRLNVYAGLAGFYLLTDANETALQNQNKLPAAPYDIGLAIQDRMFTADGQLHYPTLPGFVGGFDNSIMPEMFGNFILVNGKTWPVLEVEPRPYRFRFLNGSDSRFYNLFLSNDQTMLQIGSDVGLLASPVPVQKMLIGTGERKDVIIDFSHPALWGQTIILRNNAKTPFPKGTPPDPQTTGRIMAFKVTKPLNQNIPKAVLPASLRAPILPLQTTLAPRKLILFEAMDEYGRLMPMLGTAGQGVKSWSDPVTENIRQNDTEVWEIYNETPDAHPVHLHLVKMQLVNRQKFNATIDMATGQPTNIRLLGQPSLPPPEEAGWKDTYISYPGEVLRVIARFDLAGKYVWHCHILSHEDHEMMRPFDVQEAAGANAVSAADIQKTEALIKLDLQTVPNPFNQTLLLRFTLEKESAVTATLYDSKGAVVRQLFKGTSAKGTRQLLIDGTGMSNGVYFCELIVNGQRSVRKLVLEK